MKNEKLRAELKDLSARIPETQIAILRVFEEREFERAGPRARFPPAV
jgi:hypothetical protein